MRHLTVHRRAGEALVLGGGEIVVRVERTGTDRVRLVIECPRSIEVERGEDVGLPRAGAKTSSNGRHR